MKSSSGVRGNATATTAVLRHHMSLTCCRKSHHTPATLALAHTSCLFSIDLHTVGQLLVIARFFCFFIPNEVRCAPYLSSFKSRLTRLTKTELYLYHCTYVYGLALVIIIIIMVISKCYFSGEHIALSI